MPILSKVDILIMDDEADLATSLAEVLNKENYSTRVAFNAQEALSLVETHQFSLALCDINMPKVSGLQFVEEIRKRGVALAVVMLTASSESENIIEALRIGAVDYVSKPFETKNVLRRTPAWLELGRRLHELSAEGAALSAHKVEQQLRMIELFRLRNNSISKSEG